MSKDQVSDNEPYFQRRFDRWEITPPMDDKSGCVIEIGANQIVEIDKVFGPLCASPVRVFLEYDNDVADWVVQYQNPTTNEWEEKARWYCQESWPESK